MPYIFYFMLLLLSACSLTEEDRPYCSDPLSLKKVGVVFVHDRDEMPNASLKGLMSDLQEAGVQTLSPEMPWSTKRHLDRDLEASLDELENYVKRMKGQEVQKVAIVGYGFGSNFALRYGAAKEGVDGVAMLSPDHFPEYPPLKHQLARDVAYAKQKTKIGRGYERGNYHDEQGRFLSTAAKTYFHFFDPAGPAAMSLNALHLPKHIPVFFAYSLGDERAKYLGRASLFDKIPFNKMGKYIELAGDRKESPLKAKQALKRWLECL